ncbi:CLUMA_CG016025, isoform A [Clunio marinus]|uniref:CLUMA_CG016025, isoform A n=1 Tax=Clunio marinus TaxID=568069 RepID=A0A1J1IR47_9DIPT|nr:CLUMA_CG016025, isoform A [Clunio marinus]
MEKSSQGKAFKLLPKRTPIYAKNLHFIYGQESSSQHESNSQNIHFVYFMINDESFLYKHEKASFEKLFHFWSNLKITLKVCWRSTRDVLKPEQKF